MTRDALTGSRIRERRVMAGQKQADLAKRIGISASYLNLIEHNRRRIGGKLLLNIAAALGRSIGTGRKREPHQQKRHQPDARGKCFDHPVTIGRLRPR